MKAIQPSSTSQPLLSSSSASSSSSSASSSSSSVTLTAATSSVNSLQQNYTTVCSEYDKLSKRFLLLKEEAAHSANALAKIKTQLPSSIADDPTSIATGVETLYKHDASVQRELATVTKQMQNLEQTSQAVATAASASLGIRTINSSVTDLPKQIEAEAKKVQQSLGKIFELLGLEQQRNEAPSAQLARAYEQLSSALGVISSSSSQLPKFITLE